MLHSLLSKTTDFSPRYSLWLTCTNTTYVYGHVVPKYTLIFSLAKTYSVTHLYGIAYRKLTCYLWNQQ